MSLFGKLFGEFVDVIDWIDDTNDTLVWRFERHGNEIKYGAKLTVREGQAAVFVHEGQLADVFGPGMYELKTNNMPLLSTLQHWDHGFRSPFKSEIYFVSTRQFTDLKWGTKNPVMMRDAEFGPVRLRAFGTYAIRVSDPAKFLREVVGTDGEFTTDEITNQIRNLIVARFSHAVSNAGVPVLDLAANYDQMGAFLRDRIAPEVAEFGLTLTRLLVENVSLPEEVEKALDKRTSMGVVGDLSRYAQFQAAEGMGKGNAGLDAGIGMGAGLTMGQAMAEKMARGMTTPAAPPPIPGDIGLWHVAVDGAASGPHDRAALQKLVAAGKLTPASLVWQQGMANWQAARDQPALAALFVAPPPLG